MNDVMDIGETDISHEAAEAVMDAERNALEAYYNVHASDALRQKVADGKKTFKGMWAWLMSKAQAAIEDQDVKAVGAMTTDDWAYSNMMHYFEDETEGAIYKSAKQIERERIAEEKRKKEEFERAERKRKEAEEAAKSEEEKLAAMTAEERLAYEREKARKEAEEAAAKAERERKAAEEAEKMRIAAEKRNEKLEAKKRAEEAAKAQMTFF